jgi:hypothetical protein
MLNVVDSGHLFQGHYKAILVDIDEYTGKKLKEIGLQFGIGESGVSQSCKRVAQKIEKDKKLKKEIGRLEKKINMSRMKT